MLPLTRIREFVTGRNGRRTRAAAAGPVPAPPVPGPAAPRPVARVTLPAPALQELEAEARHHRDRLALYRARVLTAKPASAARLRELERISEAADARLRHAARRDGSDVAVDDHGAL
jgi:hypothetical protein